MRCIALQADGHCLYRSLEDQLSLAARKHTSPQASSSSGDGPELLQYQQLREAVAAHIRAHADDYLPYIPEVRGVRCSLNTGLRQGVCSEVSWCKQK